MMFELFSPKREEPLSKDIACQRLKAVLVRDRNQVTPQMLEVVRADILRVVRSYMEVDEGRMRLRLRSDAARGRDSSAIECSIPIVKMKEAGHAPTR